MYKLLLCLKLLTGFFLAGLVIWKFGFQKPIQKVSPISFDENCNATLWEAKTPLHNNDAIVIFENCAGTNSRYIGYIKKCGHFVDEVWRQSDFHVGMVQGNIIQFNTTLDLEAVAPKITSWYDVR